MFTGLVLGLGEITSRRKGLSEAELAISSSFDWEEPLAIGESISVSGVCLTVISANKRSFTAYASSETLRLTTLGEQNQVNLERALKLTDRLGGHLVSGHIDGVGRLKTSTKNGQSIICHFSCPQELARQIIPKGSITVDGVSLTVNTCGSDFFSVNIIPQTSLTTTLSLKKVGLTFNLETDLLGKYVQKLLNGQPTSGLSFEELAAKGF